MFPCLKIKTKYFSLKIKEIKHRMKTELNSVYPQEEIRSFFNLLAEEIIQLSPVETVLNAEKQLEEPEVQKFEDAILRLKNSEPIQYILGSAEFYGLIFQVNSHTLIPRPETEELIQWIFDDYSKETKTVRILDVGTGSGCIAITLAKNILNARVTAMDISVNALETARQNARDNDVKIKFIPADVLNLSKLDQEYDIIVSNPPYVRISEKEKMHPNVLLYEPGQALFVKDENPLIFYENIARLAKSNSAKTTGLYFEINEFLAGELVVLLNEAGFKNIQVKKDIYGKNRMLKCVFKKD